MKKKLYIKYIFLEKKKKRVRERWIWEGWKLKGLAYICVYIEVEKKY